MGSVRSGAVVTARKKTTRKSRTSVSYRWQRHGALRNCGEVAAEDAYAELKRIAKKRGSLDPEAIIEESKAKNAVLHPMLTWDDRVAAHRCRISEARAITYSCRRITLDIHGEEQQEPAMISLIINKEGDQESGEPRRHYVEMRNARNNIDAVRDVLRQLRGWLPRVEAFPMLAGFALQMREALDKVEIELGFKID